MSILLTICFVSSISVTEAYTINETNYLQIRAIAAMLNGTAAQFNVGWDGQFAVIEPSKQQRYIPRDVALLFGPLTN